MPKSDYETGARKYPARTGPDPSDEFSQEAAGNTPPKQGGNIATVHERDRKARTVESSTRKSPQDATELPASSGDQAEDPIAGTSAQKPRWEGPAENRPRGYLPAKDNPEEDRDAAGENLKDPERKDLGDALKKRSD